MSATQQDFVEFWNAKRELEARSNARKDSLAEFSRRAFPLVEPKRTFVPGWHLDAICEHLEAVHRGDIKNLVINIPPRHMKSLLVAVFFPAWCWITGPEKRFIFASYSDKLSKRDSIKCRRIVESLWYRDTFRIKWSLASDQNEKMRFDNTAQGTRIATSVGGAGTGEGGDIIVCDDPHKASDIRSNTIRESVIEWWDQEMSTRANDPNNFAKIIIMQRLHEKDLSGHVLARGGYEHLCLPAEYEGKKTVTSIGWEEPRENGGELLWPQRFSQAKIDELKIELGSMGAAGQLQQRPAPAEGNIVKREWWRFYKRKDLPQMDRIIQSWDLTFKDGEKNDFVAGGALGRKGADKYILDLRNERLGFNKQLDAIRVMKMKWPATNEILVEDAALAQAVIQTLRKEIPGLIAVPAQGSKIARAESVSPQIEAGNVWLPDPSECSWTETIIEQWAVFPNGAHDDIVDMMSQGLSRLAKVTITNFQPVSLKGKSKWVS